MGTYSDLAQSLASATQHYANEQSAAFALQVFPWVSSGLVVWLLIQGFQVMSGRLQEPVVTMIERASAIVFLSALAFGSGVYQVEILNSFDQFQNDMLSAVVGTQVTPYEVADEMLINGMKNVESLVSEISYDPATWFHYGIPMLIVAFGSVAITLASAGSIMLAKLGLAITLALGPIAIASLMFPATRKVFETFMEDVVSTIFSIVLVSSLMGITLQIFASAVGSYSDEQNVFFFSFQLLIIIMICIGGVKIAESKASKIFSGITAGIPNPITAAARLATAPATGAARYLSAQTGRTSALTGEKEFLTRAEHLARGNTALNPAYLRKNMENLSNRSSWGQASAKGGAVAKMNSAPTKSPTEKLLEMAARREAAEKGRI